MMAYKRRGSRAHDQLREVRITPGFTKYAEGSVLIEMGATSDGMRIMRRFTARQSLSERIIRPPSALARRLKSGFEEIIAEFDRKPFGYEVRLRTLLMEMLVHLVRWEAATGISLRPPAAR